MALKSKVASFYGDPQTFEVLEVCKFLAAGQERLGGDTASMRAGAPPSFLFDDADLRTISCGVFREGMTTWSSSDHDQIIGCSVHPSPPHTVLRDMNCGPGGPAST